MIPELAEKYNDGVMVWPLSFGETVVIETVMPAPVAVPVMVCEPLDEPAPLTAALTVSKPVPTNVNDTVLLEVMRYETPGVHGDAPQTESAGDVVNMVWERNTMVTDPEPALGVP